MQAIDTSTPSLARAYDFLLGGRANFAADRALAGRLQGMYPRARTLLSLARTFQASAITSLARGGVSQFIDVGCGLPTSPATHEAALSARSDTRVAYVDRDPAVVAHAAVMLPSVRPPAQVRVIEGDLAEPEALLWSLRPMLDFTRPACLVLGLVLQVLDPGTTRAVVGVLTRALASGSYVVVTCGAEDAGRLPDAASGAGLTAGDVESFLAGLEVQAPGVRLEPAESGSAEPGLLLCAVGRKP
ncbi:MAG TPA: SAM-dependent methyltransferase [Trebonia sp.]|nr:SAM-dependent methyltransferase [Trebonia sp.]